MEDNQLMDNALWVKASPQLPFTGEGLKGAQTSHTTNYRSTT